MMLTVLLVDTRPVKTDSKTRAGVHNDVSNPSVAQQSDKIQKKKTGSCDRRQNDKKKYRQYLKKPKDLITTNESLAP